MTRRDDSQWQDMNANEDLDERAADRLLAGELAPDDVAAGYRQVVTVLAAARAEPSAAELARQADTVRAMASARRGGGKGVDPSTASWPVRLARRRNIRLGALAAATTLSVTTGLAAAGVLPKPLQSIASHVLPSVGSSPHDSEGRGAAPLSPEPPNPQTGFDPDAAERSEAVPGTPSSPPGAKETGPQQAPEMSPGQARQDAKSNLRAEGTASGGQLVVSFQESGVGADAVTVTARADATATYGCVRRNDKKAKPSKEARTEGVSEAGSRFAAANGESGGALTLTPPAPVSVSCPSGEAPELLRVLYSRVVVLDTTTGALTTINQTFPAKP